MSDISELEQLIRQMEAVSNGDLDIAEQLSKKKEIKQISHDMVAGQLETQGTRGGRKFEDLKPSTILQKGKRFPQADRTLFASGAMERGLLSEDAINVEVDSNSSINVNFDGQPEAERIAVFHQYGTKRGLPMDDDARTVIEPTQQDEDAIGDVILDTLEETIEGIE